MRSRLPFKEICHFMIIKNQYGIIEFDFKHDLNAEESDEAYLPEYYKDRVMELKMVRSARPGGGGHLMRQFLGAPEVKSAGLIFLDCCPLFMDGKEDKTLQRLHDFYAQFGFSGVSSDGNSRLWRVQALPVSVKQCFAGGFRPQNDLHRVLLRAIRPDLPAIGRDYSCAHILDADLRADGP